MITPFRVIRTYLPLTSAQGVECLVPGLLPGYQCADFEPLLDLVQRWDPVGRVGKYAAVYGIALAAGGDVPLPGSQPRRVSTGKFGSTGVLAFTTYAAADVPLTHVHGFVEELAALHPWDHPVIEITLAELWVPETFVIDTSGR